MALQRPGMALLNVLLLTLVTTAMLVVGVQFVSSALKQGRQARGDTQVYNVARAGITHAVSWLQKQASQPVLVFDPKSNTQNPEEDPETPSGEEQLGLVSEFEIDPGHNLWGRYEVGRSAQPPRPAPARDNLAAGPHSSLYADPITWTAEDVSAERGGRAAGSVWRVRSRGYVFERPTRLTPFNGPGVRILQKMTLEAEIRRTALVYKEAALYDFVDPAAPASLQGVQVDVHAHGDRTNTELSVADGTGYAYWAGTSLIATDRVDWKGGNNVLGPVLAGASNPTSATYVSPRLADELRDIFGVPDLGKLKEMAARYYEDPIDLPQPLPTMDFVYVKPNSGVLTFNGTPQLNGGGVLVVEGDLHLKGDTATQRWDGLIFVTGNFEMERACDVTGAVICGGTALIHGYEGQVARLRYSKATLDRVNAQLSTYRVARSTIRVIEGATPRGT